MRFLDTNVILRYLTGDDQARAQACYELFQRVQRGEEELATCETIAAEVIYVLSSPRLPYRLDPAASLDFEDALAVATWNNWESAGSSATTGTSTAWPVYGEPSRDFRPASSARRRST